MSQWAVQGIRRPLWSLSAAPFGFVGDIRQGKLITDQSIVLAEYAAKAKKGLRD